jgi:hypothetical protein
MKKAILWLKMACFRDVKFTYWYTRPFINFFFGNKLHGDGWRGIRVFSERRGWVFYSDRPYFCGIGTESPRRMNVRNSSPCFPLCAFAGYLSASREQIPKPDCR